MSDKPEVKASPLRDAAFDAAVAEAVKIVLANQQVVPGNSAMDKLVEVSATNSKLVEVLAAREARESKGAQELERKIAARQVQNGINSQASEIETQEKQKRCKHLKGGALQKKGHKDYNVHCHRFTDGEEVITCDTCRMKWKIRDTKEFLYRGESIVKDGRVVNVLRKMRNHTGIGWHEAKLMLEDSTSTLSSSEVVMTVNPAAMQPAATSTAQQAYKQKAIEQSTILEETEI